jgi:hypothetical protein
MKTKAFVNTTDKFIFITAVDFEKREVAEIELRPGEATDLAKLGLAETVVDEEEPLYI